MRLGWGRPDTDEGGRPNDDREPIGAAHLSSSRRRGSGDAVTPSLPRLAPAGHRLTDDHRRFRDRLCSFLGERLTPEVRAAQRDLTEQDGWSAAFCREFKAALGSEGFLGYAWPSAYGGGDGDLLHDHLLADELEYHRAPGYGEPSLTYVPHTLLRSGTEAQRQAMLPGLRAGATNVFLGYSEPEAGSDLANIASTAVPDGDEFLITGQKSYSSRADRAHYGLVIARTDPGSHRFPASVGALRQRPRTAQRHRRQSG
jgi:alkylation response protein AidB-like acyl-CoA dehydrogenase